MGRTARDRREHLPRPVQKIELHSGKGAARLAAALILLVVGVSLILYSLNGGFAVSAGWTEIQAASGEANCSGDFTFLYPLGTTASPAAERKGLVSLYSEACEEAYRLFTNDLEFEGVHNVRFLNAHPNQEVLVEEALYGAFARIAESGDRSLYLAPVYESYDGVFHCEDPSRTADFDPYQNESLRAWFARVCAFASDPSQVELELLEDCRVRLKVSEEYLDFAETEEIGSFIDFYWMKNAFVADYLAERLTEAGYAAGTLSSFDGFSRNLDSGEDQDYSLNLYDREGGVIRPPAVLHYRGARSMVCLRNYPLNAGAGQYYCVMDDGEIRTPFLSPEDGLCRSAVNDLTAYSAGAGCAEILLKLIPVYVADELRAELLAPLAEEGIQSIYCQDGVIYHTEAGADLRDLYAGEDVRYVESAELP